MFLCVIKLRDDFRFTNKAPLQGGERHPGHIVATDKAPLQGGERHPGHIVAATVISSEARNLTLL